MIKDEEEFKKLVNKIARKQVGYGFIGFFIGCALAKFVIIPVLIYYGFF